MAFAAAAIAAPHVIRGAGWFGKNVLGIGRGKRRRQQEEEARRRAQFEAAAAREGEQADRSRAQFDQAANFDPYAEFRMASRGAVNEFQRDFRDELGDLRGRQVGMGRLDTGFATRDDDRLFTDMSSRLNDRIAQGAMQAGQQRLQQAGMHAGMAESAQGRYMDATFGGYATDRMAREQEAASKRQFWAQLGSAGMQVAGQYLPTRRSSAPAGERVSDPYARGYA